MTQRDLIKRHGGATAVARVLGVHVTTVFRWQRDASRMPASAHIALCHIAADKPMR
jgi:DNA-binding transcriptional regulator YdaS (Cro superfamily)